MRLRLGPAADLDGGDEILAPGNYRDRMANITLQTDRFILCVEMLPVMAAETTWRFDMPQVIRMCRPIHLLIMKYCARVNILDCLHSSRDLLSVSSIILAGLVG